MVENTTSVQRKLVEMDLNELTKKVTKVCALKKWDKDWLKGGCYIHLEVSEFIESLRGKGDDPPEKEAADVMFTLLAVMDHYGISIESVLNHLNDVVDGHLESSTWEEAST